MSANPASIRFGIRSFQLDLSLAYGNAVKSGAQRTQEIQPKAPSGFTIAQRPIRSLDEIDELHIRGEVSAAPQTPFDDRLDDLIAPVRNEGRR
jgi:hypothetical protein